MTSLNPLALLVVFIMSILAIVLRRENAFIPLAITAVYITMAQKVIIASIDFTLLRVLIIIYFFRLIVFDRENSTFPFSKIDFFMFAWAISSIITYTILWGTFSRFVYKAGILYDSLGAYIIGRCLIRDIDDFERIVKAIVIILIPLAGAMMLEKMTGKNVFHFLGGVPEYAIIRDGKIRCQGSFRHPILTGTFAATTVPMIISLWWFDSRLRKYVIIGTACAAVICVATASSGPLMSLSAGLGAMVFWRFRRYLCATRWTIFVSIFVLHFFVMKSPVWHLIGRLSNVIGGGGWHRAYLIDQAVKYFSDWWLVGVKVTGHWMPTQLAYDPTRADITNHFIAQGVDGGLITMVLFIMICIHGFKGVGKGLHEAEEYPFYMRIGIWSMGATLFSHIVTFTSVSYFDQITVFWYMLFAFIAAIQYGPLLGSGEKLRSGRTATG